VAARARPSQPHSRPKAKAGLSLLDRGFSVRDRLLESPDFQRFSAAFPLTRGIAHRHARALFDLCAGFVYSQVLTACVRLDVFKRLSASPKTLAELACELDLPLPAAERLLLAACSLKLLSRRNPDRFALGMLGAALNGNPGIAAMIEHHAVLYRDLADPVALLRGHRGQSELSRYWSYAGGGSSSALDGASVGDYSALMAASQSFIAEDVLDSYPFRRHRTVLDVGGGEGAFVAAAAKRFRDLQFIVFDLPAVAERACANLGRMKLMHRATVVGGSFFSDALPGGADLVTLVRVLHDHDNAEALELLRAVHAALPPGGVVLVAEPMAGTAGSEPVGDAYFGMYLFAMGQGRPRAPAEIVRLLESAGFSKAQPRKTRRPMLVCAVVATKNKHV
jgi:demethylspheroidene O-methyltransferase